MSPINSIGPLGSSPVIRLEEIQPAGLAGPHVAPSSDSFGTMLDGLLRQVAAKDDAADAATRSVLLGQSDQLHRAVILGAEADVSFVLMVEMRNKLLESYQELMRMQA